MSTCAAMACHDAGDKGVKESGSKAIEPAKKNILRRGYLTNAGIAIKSLRDAPVTCHPKD